MRLENIATAVSTESDLVENVIEDGALVISNMVSLAEDGPSGGEVEDVEVSAGAGAGGWIVLGAGSPKG